MSTPMTIPSGPTALAARKQSKPAPDPMSSTYSPRFRDAMATGFPQPRPRFDSGGAESISSSVYPILLLISTAGPAPQHDPEQHDASFAIREYPSLTALLISLSPSMSIIF